MIIGVNLTIYEININIGGREKMNALIGYTGFVGSNLNEQFIFDSKYNSKNIEEIENNQFDLIVCAGVPGTKWLANKNPDEDLKSIKRLMKSIEKAICNKFVLISTIDVYKETSNVDEDTFIDIEGLHGYGRNRVLVEKFVDNNFNDYHIIRLPAIYGKGIKKNFVYDLLNNHCLHWTHKDSVFQFYHLKNLWRDIEVVLKNDIRVINFNSQPIKAEDLAWECFNQIFTNITERKPWKYNVKSKYSCLFGKHEYMYTRNQVLNEMKEFIKQYKSELV